MTETNTSGIITAAADIVAGAFNALPKRVCNQHNFSDYADYLHENLPAQAELDLQREKPLHRSFPLQLPVREQAVRPFAQRSKRSANKPMQILKFAWFRSLRRQGLRIMKAFRNSGLCFLTAQRTNS